MCINMKEIFNHFDLKIINPSYDSKLTDIVLELEKLRPGRRITTRVHPIIFHQLKQVFHLLESLGSVRIEGNNTTLSEMVEKTIEGQIESTSEESIKEYENNLEALSFIEDNVKEGVTINRMIISEFHKIIVQKLSVGKEGDRTPGVYRNHCVRISQSNHQPPPPEQIQGYMDELFNFIETYSKESKYNLLATSLVHHRFAWVHPFGNGNGRVVRLLTYAMLLSTGFSVQGILNPTAIFCIDRDRYYEMLSKADSGTEEGLLSWCEYVLSNLKVEITKIEKILDENYLFNNILFPALKISLEKKILTEDEYLILTRGCQLGEFKAGDVKNRLGKKYPYEITRILNQLKERNMIDTLPDSSRKYFVVFTKSLLLRGLIEMLKKESFVPFSD